MMGLYVLPITETAQLPPELCKNAFPERERRSRRYRHEEDRLRCIGAGALLAGILGVREAELLQEEGGRLVLPGSPFRFSLSHSGNYTVLSVDTMENGVDMERMEERHLDLAPRVYTPQELDWMQCDPVRRFFRLWTMKESVMKLHGLGMKLDPASFSVLNLMERDRGLCRGEMLYTYSTELDGHSLSLCSIAPPKEIQPKILCADELTEKLKGVVLWM